MLSVFEDPKSQKAQRDVDWALKRWNTEVGTAISFLGNSETPIAGICCTTEDISYDNDRDDMIPPDGFLWLTNRRLLFVCKTGGGLFKKPEPFFLEFDFSSLTSINYNVTGTLFKEVRVVLYVSTTSASGKVVDISFRPHHTSKVPASEFVRKVQDHVKRVSSQSVASSRSTESGSDLVAALNQLDTLRKQGALSDQEFHAAKKRLLGT
jgi:hypothetical protein